MNEETKAQTYNLFLKENYYKKNKIIAYIHSGISLRFPVACKHGLFLRRSVAE